MAASPENHRKAAAIPNPWLPATTLGWREIQRFFRQRNRVVGAIATPVLFWLLFGAGLSRTFRVEEQSFSQYYFPGTMLMIILFTAIFTTISVIEDRKEGFLQSVLVSPTPRWAMVVGKVMGGSVIASIQALIFLALGFVVGLQLSPLSWLATVGWIFLTSVALTALGFGFAWRMESTQGFHAIMNLVLMPMGLRSGAFFPVPPLAESDWTGLTMHWIMRFNPLTYAVAGLRRLLYSAAVVPGDAPTTAAEMWLPSLAACVMVMLVFTVVVMGWAISRSRHTTSGDLQ